MAMILVSLVQRKLALSRLTLEHGLNRCYCCVLLLIYILYVDTSSINKDYSNIHPPVSPARLEAHSTILSNYKLYQPWRNNLPFD